MDNWDLNNSEFNSKKIILKSTPKAIFIQASGPCNSNCIFCSRGNNYELFNLETHVGRFNKNLSPFISRAEQLVLTGSGEFLQLPDAERILDYFDNAFPYVEKVFSTNGSSLTPQICKRIAYSKSKYTIHVSLHASNSGLHKLLTRADNFNKIISQVGYLLSLRKDTGSPRLFLIFVATTLNIDDLPNFIRLTSSLGADKMICYYNYIYIPTQKYLSCFFKQDITNNMLTEADALARKLKLEICLPAKFGLNRYSETKICPEPWSQIMVNAQGHILPCDASEDTNESLNGKNFMDVWNGAYYQNLRKSLIEGSCPCFKHCFRANPASVNDFRSHVIHRGKRTDIDILWGDNF